MITKPPVPYDLCINDPTRRFQPGEGPSRGLLRDCEIFSNLRLTFVSSSISVAAASVDEVDNGGGQAWVTGYCDQTAECCH